MTKKDKLDKLEESLINKMLEKYNVTFDTIKSNLNEDKRWLIDGKDWYTHYTLTESEYQEYKKWAIDEIKRVLRVSKKFAENEFSWWYLNVGLSVKD